MKNELIIGLFVVLAAVGTTYFITEENINKVYFCNATGIIGICEKLSSPNDGISIRCYYNITKYKLCSSGWELFKEIEFIGNELPEPLDVNISDEIKETLKFTKYNLSDIYCNKYECSPLRITAVNTSFYCSIRPNDIAIQIRSCEKRFLTQEYTKEIIKKERLNTKLSFEKRERII